MPHKTLNWGHFCSVVLIRSDAVRAELKVVKKTKKKKWQFRGRVAEKSGDVVLQVGERRLTFSGVKSLDASLFIIEADKGDLPSQPLG